MNTLVELIAATLSALCALGIAAFAAAVALCVIGVAAAALGAEPSDWDWMWSDDIEA